MSWDRVARVCFAATAVIAIVSLGLQFGQDWFGAWYDPGVTKAPHSVETWRFFGYFTTQSNLLVAATSLSLAGRADRDGPGWRVARLDALSGITITGLVHWLLLRPLDDYRGWLWVSDTLVHVVVPVLAVLGWLVFGPRPRVDLRVVLLGLTWPLAWLSCTLLAGGLTGWYPYFFLDVGVSGVGTVSLYCAAILILLFTVSCLFWWGDRRLPAARASGVGRPVGR